MWSVSRHYWCWRDAGGGGYLLMIIRQFILGLTTMQSDFAVNISMLSAGQFLHSFRRMKQTLPVSFPAFPCRSTLRLFRSILQWIISAALLTTLAWNWQWGSPPVCLRAENKNRDREVGKESTTEKRQRSPQELCWFETRNNQLG